MFNNILHKMLLAINHSEQYSNFLMNPNTKLNISSSSKSAINDTYVFSEIRDCPFNPETFLPIEAKNIKYIGESDPNKYIDFLIENNTPDIISLVSVSRINTETNPITYGYEWAYYLGSNLNPIKSKGKKRIFKLQYFRLYYRWLYHTDTSCKSL